MTHLLRAAGSALAALALLASGVTGATSASAAPAASHTWRGGVVYDALGDSYASGYGVPPYDGSCGRSQSAYAEQLNGRMRIRLDDFVACAGATTTSLVSGGQLNALNAHTNLVTLTIGGNDIGWSSAVVACLGGTDSQCAGAVAATRSNITTNLPGLLDSLYTQVAQQAPRARVVVTGYPRLFSPRFGSYLGASAAEQRALNDGANVLNRVIAKEARKHGFTFVDVTNRFQGHGVNAPSAWILGPTDPAAFHPTLAGYRAYTAAILSSLRHCSAHGH
ncbi:MAG: SGNH/GDSL hydrolase family protein [Humibacillus sp.]|nr:SGNH/GDSL hydrolase family protein [Humibacillus sp.]MDN5777830.1 SGNH/GDSL hydrolase family protein [Humibacillus sp.]